MTRTGALVSFPVEVSFLRSRVYLLNVVNHNFSFFVFLFPSLFIKGNVRRRKHLNKWTFDIWTSRILDAMVLPHANVF